MKFDTILIVYAVFAAIFVGVCCALLAYLALDALWSRRLGAVRARQLGLEEDLVAPLKRIARVGLRRATGVARRWAPRVFVWRDSRRGQRHGERCARDLPDMIDILTLGLQAGLSFDAALDAYLERFDTPLAAEFELAQRSYQLGMCSRRQAFRRLCERVPDDAVMRFVTVVVEALALGAPLLSTFSTLSFELRRYQKLKLEERIARAPVKLLMPLGLCVLPAVLILLMGPVLIQMIAGLRL